MKGALTIEQMEFLLAKGLDAGDMIALAKMGAAKSKGAERIARWRAKKAAEAAGETPESVTNGVTCNALPPPIEDHTPPVSSNDEIRAKPKRAKSTTPAKPADVSGEVWEAFTALRRKKGGLSDIALAGIRREASKAGWTLEAALTRCVEKNWQGFEAEWVANTPKAANGDGYLDHLIAKKARGP